MEYPLCLWARVYGKMNLFFLKKSMDHPLLNFFMKYSFKKKNTKLKDFSKKQNFFMQTFALQKNDLWGLCPGLNSVKMDLKKPMLHIVSQTSRPEKK
jgi:hypothetical protein